MIFTDIVDIRAILAVQRIRTIVDLVGGLFLCKWSGLRLPLVHFEAFTQVKASCAADYRGGVLRCVPKWRYEIERDLIIAAPVNSDVLICAQIT